MTDRVTQQTTNRLQTMNIYRETFERLMAHYHLFIPGILIVWIMLEVVAQGLEKGIVVLAQVGLFCITSAFYVSAASKSAGRWTQGTFWLAIERGSGHSITLIISSLGLFLLLFAIYLVGVLFGLQHDNISHAKIMIILWLLVASLLLTRLWPIYVTLFLYAGYSRWSPAGKGALWHGPSFVTAWRMTAKRGTFFRCTVPLFVTGLLLVGVPLIVRYRLTNIGVVVFLLNLFLYGAALPFVTTLAYGFAEKLRVKTRYDLHEKPSPETVST